MTESTDAYKKCHVITVCQAAIKYCNFKTIYCPITLFIYQLTRYKKKVCRPMWQQLQDWKSTQH